MPIFGYAALLWILGIVLSVVFSILKLTGNVAWGWGWVAAPVLAASAFGVLVLGLLWLAIRQVNSEERPGEQR